MANEGLDMFKTEADRQGATPPPPAPPPEQPKEEAESGGFMGGLRVSLMPSGEGEDAESLLRKRLVILFAVLIVETIVIGGVFLYVSRLEADKTAVRQELEASLAQVTDQIRQSEAETEEMTAFDARVRAATDLLDSHVYWTSLFDYLRSTTKPSVIFLNFAGDYNGAVVTLDAIAPTYRAVAEQIVILREDPMVDDVISSSASASINELGEVLGVSFGLVLKLNPVVWSSGLLTSTDEAATGTFDVEATTEGLFGDEDAGPVVGDDAGTAAPVSDNGI